MNINDFENDVWKKIEESNKKMQAELHKQIEDEFKWRIRNLGRLADAKGNRELVNLAHSMNLASADLDSEEGVRKVRDAFLENGYEISLQQGAPEYSTHEGEIKIHVARSSLKLIVKKVMEF